ncbi:MAG TPA: protein kinase [Planctomycetota bacterium]|jgi:hypothetical protein
MDSTRDLDSDDRTIVSDKSPASIDASAPTPTDDLTQDTLLANAPRVSRGERPTPAVGGIPLLSRLGRGGMGAVYFGIHPRLNVEVAVKILPTQLADDSPDAIQRFFREAQLAAKIKSPHLVSVIDVNSEGGLFYLVMEYVGGPSAGGHLRQMKQSGPPGLDEMTALDICIAATDGLACAHSENIIHRDIKPDNILIPKSKAGDALLFKSAKLADLGLARMEEAGPGLTQNQSAMGTPGYMAPEQATDAKNAGKASDVFSMGATLYTLLSGRAPFSGKTVMTIIVATIQQPHEPIEQVCAGVSRPTAALIDRCLAKNPLKRPADAAVLLEELRACRAQFDDKTAATSSSVTLLSGPPPGARKSRKLGWIAAALGVLASAGVLAWLGWQYNLEQARRHEAEAKAQQSAEQARVADEARQSAESEQKKAEAALRARRVDSRALRNSADKTAAENARLVDEQKKAQQTFAETASASIDAASKATVEAAHRADELRSLLADEKKAKAENERLTQEANAAQDGAKKAEGDAIRHWEEVLKARAWNKAAEEALARSRTHQTIEQAKLRAENLKSADEAWQKLRDEKQERQGAAHKASEAAQAASQAAQHSTEARAKAEQAATAATKDAARLGDIARSAADKYQSVAHEALSVPDWYKLADGPCAVESMEDLALHDATRNKDLHLRIYYPKPSGAELSAGGTPAILISHGLNGSKEWYNLISQFWATHGYICLHLQHSDTPLKSKTGTPAELDQKNLDSRVRDIVLALDSFPEIRRKAPSLKEKLKGTQAALCAHGYASAAALSLSAGLQGLSGERRIGALLLLAPQGYEPPGAASESWKKLTSPMMATLNSPVLASGQRSEPRWEPFRSAAAGDKYLLAFDGQQRWINGVTRAADTAGDQDDATQRDWAKSASIAFWDAHLKSDPKAKAYLNSDALPMLAKHKLALFRR